MRGGSASFEQANPELARLLAEWDDFPEYVADNLGLLGLKGSLRAHPEHPINPEYLRYHRKRIYQPMTN